MARKQGGYINRGNRKPNALVPALAIVLASALTAFVGAYAWQGLSGDGQKYQQKKEMLEAAHKQPTSTASAKASQSSSPNEGEATPQASGDSNASGIQQTEQSVVPQSSESSQVSQHVAVVPEGTRALSTYFDDALFVGDSITDGIRAYELMKNATIISFTGINPDSIRTKAVYRDQSGNLVTMLQGMAQYPNSKKIYVMLGSNSAAWMDEKLFLEYYEEFLRSVIKQHPEATVYVQGITPINEAEFKQNYSGQNLTNAKINQINADLIKMAEKLGIYYLAVGDALRDADGQLSADATSDGLHFSTRYYQKWFDYLKTHTVGALPVAKVTEGTPQPSIADAKESKTE